MATHGDISYGLTIGAGKGVVRNAGDTAFETRYTDPDYYKYSIVRTVDGSGNLTVALKNYLGTDPSTATPVKVQIGDTVRTITSALSITAGTPGNYLNLGSNELANKEVDLFVYLIYSTSSNKVELGFSRLPYGNVFSDLNANGLLENGLFYSAAINTSDSMVNIGRFNAILSAGAGYTWSIPATSVIINRPCFETRHLFQNIIVGDGTNNATITINGANYRIDGNFLNITIDTTISDKGVCNGAVIVKTPFSVSGVSGTHSFSGGFKGGLGGIGTPIIYQNAIRFNNSNSSFSELPWSSVTNGDRFIATGSYPI